MTFVPDQIVGHNGGNYKAMQSYERLLRVVGQALEKNHFHSFELTPSRGGFHIRGVVEAPPKENLAERATNRIRSLLERSPNRNDSDGPGFRAAGNGAGAPGLTELLLTIPDIERLEREGQARRVEASRMVNTSSLPQVLRCLGGYLSQKRARLVKLVCESDGLTLEYETSLGSQRKEIFSATAIYDIWVRMYLQRAGRGSRKTANAGG